MKIGYVLRSLEDSGVTVYVLRLADAMRKRGHEVFLVSDGGMYEPEVKRLGLRHIPLPLCRGLLKSYIAARKLAEIVRREKPDILHANWRRAQMACHLAERATGVPFVSTLHLVGIPDNWLYRRMTHWGRAVIAPCTEAVEYLRSKFRVPQDRIALIFHGVDPDQWPVVDDERRAAARAEFALPLDAPVAVCVARLEAIKGHDVLLAAMARAVAERPELRLLLVGAGAEEANLRRQATSLGLDGNVQFLGWTDPHQALAAADVFVLASRRESFGLAPVEAMMSGRAVIRTDTQGAHDQIEAGTTGLILPIDDVAALGQALADFAANRACWLEMGVNAANQARERFLLAATGESVECIYIDIINRRQPPMR